MTAFIALPIALAIDLLTVVLLRRGLSLGRDASIAVALVVTVVAWGVTARVIDVLARRRSNTETPPG